MHRFKLRRLDGLKRSFDFGVALKPLRISEKFLKQPRLPEAAHDYPTS
jgi:hypothetical protein